MKISKNNKFIILAIFLFVTILILTVVLRKNNNEQQELSPSALNGKAQEGVTRSIIWQTNTSEREQNNGEDAPSLLKGLRSYCVDQYPEFPFPEEDELTQALTHPEARLLWKNEHLQAPDGEVYRLRIFSDDGPNGQITRLAVYREDEEGFPVLLELADDERINPTQETIERYRELGELIHHEEALGVDYQGREYFFEVINSEVVRIDITSAEGAINCQAL